MLIIKGLIASLLESIVFAFLLIIPAGLLPNGTWFWFRAIIFCLIYFIISVITVFYIAIVAPAGLEARLKKAPKNEKRPKSDKILLPLLVFTIIIIFVGIPVDRFALELLPMPGLIGSTIGVGMIVIGLLMKIRSIITNAYISTTIQDQTDEGQKVADTGVYRIIRHPMYLSLLLFFSGTALWLESWTGVLFNIPFLIVIIVRILVEEKQLKETLPGYCEYMKKVKYRIIPFVW